MIGMGFVFIGMGCCGNWIMYQPEEVPTSPTQKSMGQMPPPYASLPQDEEAFPEINQAKQAIQTASEINAHYKAAQSAHAEVAAALTAHQTKAIDKESHLSSQLSSQRGSYGTQQQEPLVRNTVAHPPPSSEETAWPEDEY